MALALLSGPQDPSQITAYINTLIGNLAAVSGGVEKAGFAAPLAADLVYVKTAATPANGAITIAHQPDYPRKLQVRVVIGTGGTTNITAGTLTLVGTNAQGAAVSEVISLIAAASETLTTANAYANLASGTVANYAASGSGTGNTLGIGQSAALGLPLPPTFSNLIVFKENTGNADEAVGAVDPVAGTITPTTVPTGSANFDFWYSYASGQ